jgi:hypothetical protein
MSIIHGINLKLNSKFNIAAIQQILQQGLDLNCIYFAEEECIPTIMNLPDLIEKIMREPRDEDNMVYTKQHDTYFYLRIAPSEGNKMEVSIGNLMYPWVKPFRSNDKFIEIDFARYISLLLCLCKGFPVLEIETYSI